MAFRPFALDLSGRRIVCVGGGRVGTRRALAFADAGALVRVISPQVSPQLAGDPRISVTLRAFEEADLDDADLVHTATGCEAVDEAVMRAATRRRLWCVDATDAARASAHVLLHRQAGKVTLAVHSNGDPRRSRAIADHLLSQLPAGLDGAAVPAHP